MTYNEISLILYKQYMDKYFRPYLNKEDWIRREEEDKHHIFPTSRWGQDVYDNKTRLYTWFHKGFHRVFGNWTPQENIQQLVKVLRKSLTEEVQQDLFKILSEKDNKYWYKDWIWLSLDN